MMLQQEIANLMNIDTDSLYKSTDTDDPVLIAATQHPDPRYTTMSPDTPSSCDTSYSE